MSGVLDVPKPRINCSMLSQHINRAVCFVGRVEKVSVVLANMMLGSSRRAERVINVSLTHSGSFLRCQVHPTGKTFTVADGEGKIATVELNEPVSNVTLCSSLDASSICNLINISTQKYQSVFS